VRRRRAGIKINRREGIEEEQYVKEGNEERITKEKGRKK
jgi:hypothetical protein